MTDGSNKASANKRWIKIAVAIAALILFAYAGRNYYAELHRIAEAKLIGVLGIAVLHLLTLWVTGITFKLGLEAYDEKVTRADGFKMSTLAAYSNLLLPRAGLGLVAAYLKRTRNVSLTHFGCVILFNAAILLSTVTTAGLVALTLMPSMAGKNAGWAALSLAAVAVASLGATRIRIHVPDTWNGRIFSLLRKFADGSAKLGVGKYLVRLWLAHAFMTILRSMRLVCAFWALDLSVNVIAVNGASLLGDLAFLLSVTPTGLGFREAAVASISTSMGVTTAMAVSVAILDRLVFSLTNAVAAQLILANSWWRQRNGNARRGQPQAEHKIAFVATRETSYSRVSIIRTQLKSRFTVDEYISDCVGYTRRMLDIICKLLWSKLTGRLSTADVVFVGFFAQPIFPLVRLLYRGPIVVDAYFSLFDTMVNDKAKTSSSSLLGRLCFWLDQHMLREATLCITDTIEHAKYMRKTFDVPQARIERLWVSTENKRLEKQTTVALEAPFRVFFWGNYIPLQGVPIIVEAANQLKQHNVEFTLVGRGQTFPESEQLASQLNASNIEFKTWMTPEEIVEQAEASHLALGIFGTTEKAGRVIPNKVYQALAMGLPLITRQSPAASELLEDNINCLFVPAGDPTELAAKILWVRDHYEAAREIADAGAQQFEHRCSPEHVGKILASTLTEVLPVRNGLPPACSTPESSPAVNDTSDDRVRKNAVPTESGI